MTLPNFIIGGVNKAGTSSIFTYLNSHPDVCGSSIKEVTFFKGHDDGRTLDEYESYFEACPPGKKIVFEASQSYYRRGPAVARQIIGMNPNIRMLFVLREPASRLHSFFNFRAASNKMNSDITFTQYVDKCFAFTLNKESPHSLGLRSKQLACLGTGRYARYLREFFEVIPREQIKVMFLENMRVSPADFMKELCQFLDIDGDFYTDFTFRKVNESIQTKSKKVHKLALSLNSGMEAFFHRRPRLKAKLVRIYKLLNGNTKTGSPIPDSVQRKLQEFYKDSNAELLALLGDYENLPDWVKGESQRSRPV